MPLRLPQYLRAFDGESDDSALTPWAVDHHQGCENGSNKLSERGLIHAGRRLSRCQRDCGPGQCQLSSAAVA